MEISPGTLLDRYEVRSRLGAGGMAEVFLAYDPHLGRNVAIKILPGSVAGDASRLARFVREAKAASALNHPNIVTVYDFGVHDETRFLVVEYVDGQTLRDWTAESRPEINIMLDAVAQAATALEVAHRAGIVHRDIKPENVMRRRDGLVKVLDFGVAKLLDDAAVDAGDDTRFDTQRIRPGALVGTLRYMSPEQASADEVDARTDVWSLGVVLYELLSGKKPFTGKTSIDIMAAIMRREPEPLEQAAPGTPEAVSRLVERTLRKEKEERPGAAELAAELRRLRDTIGATPTAEPTETIVDDVETQHSGDRTTWPASLPEPASPLIGRARELAELEDLVREARLVTVTGTGGSGKTRLAIEAARDLAREFPDGVFLVELAPLRSAAYVAPQVAGVLGVNEHSGIAIEGGLSLALAGKEILLLLDNFEHVAEAAALVAALLAAAPRLKALVTSRSPLHVRDEREYPLGPLDLPSASSDATLYEIEAAGAVALFVERVRAVRPSFELTAENAPAVCEICRRLDGLPLAIELAAARARFLTPEDMVGRLDNRLKLLTSGTRDMPDRQRTMRAAVSWSYDLLEPHEQEVLRRLAVFDGGCTLEAAEAVCAGEDVETLDAVTSLVDGSLLRHVEQADGQTRFAMFEVVREFGLERLAEEGELDAVRLSHGRYFLRYAEAAMPGLTSASSSHTVERLARDHENLRAALAFLLDREPAEGARLVVPMTLFCQFRGLYHEGYAAAESALATDRCEPSVRAKLLLLAGVTAKHLGEFETAAAYARDCIEASRSIDDRVYLARAFNLLGLASMHRHGELADARAAYEGAIAILREVRNPRLESIVLNNLSEVARLEGDYAAARAYAEQAIACDDVDRQTQWRAIKLINLGAICYREGDLTRSRSSYGEALSIASEIGSPLYCGYALDGLAALALEDGDARRAARFAGAAQVLYERAGVPLEPFERELRDEYVARLDQVLDEDIGTREWEQGRTAPFETILAEALGPR